MTEDFFAAKLLKRLDEKPALQGLIEAMAASRSVGFDYADDEEAVQHFESEAQEVAEAFRHESPGRSISEAGDLMVILVELVRRRGGDLDDATRASTGKFLKRLQFVENKMRSEGKTWKDVGSWKDDVKPNYWDKAKAAGL